MNLIVIVIWSCLVSIQGREWNIGDFIDFVVVVVVKVYIGVHSDICWQIFFQAWYDDRRH